MAIALPDTEMRKFLANGTPDSVRSALSVHVSHGLEILDLTAAAFTLRLDQMEVTGPTRQQLKKTVAVANGLFLGD